MPVHGHGVSGTAEPAASPTELRARIIVSQLGNDLLHAVARRTRPIPPFGVTDSANTTHQLDQMKGGRTRRYVGVRRSRDETRHTRYSTLPNDPAATAVTPSATVAPHDVLDAIETATSTAAVIAPSVVPTVAKRRVFLVDGLNCAIGFTVERARRIQVSQFGPCVFRYTQERPWR